MVVVVVVVGSARVQLGDIWVQASKLSISITDAGH
jgi:hypothetical protein